MDVVFVLGNLVVEALRQPAGPEVGVGFGLFADFSFLYALLNLLVELFELCTNQFVVCILALRDVAVFLRFLAPVLEYLIVGLPVALAMEEGRLVKEVQQVERVFRSRHMIRVIVGERLPGGHAFERVAQ